GAALVAELPGHGAGAGGGGRGRLRRLPGAAAADGGDLVGRARPDPVHAGSRGAAGRRLTGRHPHTSAATLTTSPSLATCSAWVRVLPSTVEEKPHCGDRHSWSRGTHWAASSMRRFSSSLLSRAARLVVTRPSTTRFDPRGTKRSGAKPPERASSYSRKKPSTASSPN